MMPTADAYDVVVIGAGTGGMTAAAVAAAEELRALLMNLSAAPRRGRAAWSGFPGMPR
jgi:succinate dehydrogenase/fumarate reductase flavoprotein subunit